MRNGPDEHYHIRGFGHAQGDGVCGRRGGAAGRRGALPGVGKRPLHGAVRKSLIANDVTAAWRETSEPS